MDAGPPWYAARCKFDEGHTSDHDFGTQQEAEAAFRRSFKKMIDNQKTKLLVALATTHGVMQTQFLPGLMDLFKWRKYDMAVNHTLIRTGFCLGITLRATALIAMQLIC